MATSVVPNQLIIIWPVPTATIPDNPAVGMHKKIQEIVTQVGTDVSGKWISVDNAEKFAQLVIQAYNKELKDSRRETKRKLGYSRIGLNNV